jgi:two-component system LytT family response regulator/two-component system response regulator LytT
VSEPIRVLIVDDEELARARIKGLLGAFDDLECVGEAENGLEAVERIRDLRPDLVFLDIQMPGMDGFEVLAALEDVPLIVFATAYDEYALKAFEVNSIDYLLKPIEKERLAQAVERARELLSGDDLGREIERIAGLVRVRGVDRLPVQKGKKIILVDHADIVWIEASEGLVFVHTADQRFLANTTMAELETRLDPATFFRTHRSSIVNLNHVVEIVPWFGGKYKVIVDDDGRSEVVLSRARAKALRAIFPW